MSQPVDCPYCDELFDYDGDEEGFTQDSEQEFTCTHCGETCVGTVYWSLCITNERKKHDTSLDSK